MSTLSDLEAGKLIAVVEQLETEIKSLRETTSRLTYRVNELDIQLSKGKGFLAGAMLLSMGLGGVGTSFLSKWLGT